MNCLSKNSRVRLVKSPPPIVTIHALLSQREQSQLETLLAALDTNKDGQISWKEFEDGLQGELRVRNPVPCRLGLATDECIKPTHC